MKPSVFITGGAGYLGSRFVRAAREHGVTDMICLDERGSQDESAGTEWVVGDILEPDTYRKALARCHTVIHMAEASGKQDPATFVRDNITATFQLLQACASEGVERFLHVSTVVANLADTADYVYADTKKSAEQLVAGSGIRHTIVRPTLIAGDGAPVLEHLVRLASRRVIPVFGRGDAKVQPVWVGDLVEVMLCILQEGWFENDVVEVGGPEVIRMQDLLQAIRVARGMKPGTMIYVPLGLVSPPIRLLERFALRYLPVTTGQLRAFDSDRTAQPHAYLQRWQGRMKGLREMLRPAVVRAR